MDAPRIRVLKIETDRSRGVAKANIEIMRTELRRRTKLKGTLEIVLHADAKESKRSLRMRAHDLVLAFFGFQE
jgi:hypothetical protein